MLTRHHTISLFHTSGNLCTRQKLVHRPRKREIPTLATIFLSLSSLHFHNTVHHPLQPYLSTTSLKGAPVTPVGTSSLPATYIAFHKEICGKKNWITFSIQFHHCPPIFHRQPRLWKSPSSSRAIASTAARVKTHIG